MVLIVILIPLVTAALTTHSDQHAPATLLEIIFKAIHSTPTPLLIHSAPTAVAIHSAPTALTTHSDHRAPTTHSAPTAPKTPLEITATI